MIKNFFLILCIISIVVQIVIYTKLHYVTTQEKILILILCHDKTNDFKNMLNSLLKVRGIPSRVDILVSQSGTNMDIHDIASYHGLNIIQHDDSKLKLENRLANHFKWSFDVAFELFPHNNGLIVLEDDFLFSPDFLEYFELTIPVLSTDPTLFTVSAWNDIGFKQNTNDIHNIKRVSFFPGLGWYLSRTMWENNLKHIWPSSDWDWVVRKYVEMNKLDILIPEISRDYHAANTGTYMKKHLFNQYFRDIALNNDISFRWDSKDISHVDIDSYMVFMVSQLQNNNNKIIFISDKRVLQSRSFANKYHVWHEPNRGAWRGIRMIWDKTTKQYILIVNLRSNPEWSFYRRPSVTL